MENYFAGINLILLLIYLLVLTSLIFIISSVNYSDDLFYRRLFRMAFLYKILAGLSFGLIYDFYYGREADTFYYFKNASYLGEMFFTNPKAFWMMFFNQVTPETVYQLGELTYYPRFYDTQVYAIHRFLSLFTVVGIKNYYMVSLCLNTFLFFVNWKIYRSLVSILKGHQTIVAIAILFIPSATFWSSGIIKDSFTYSFSLLFFVYFYKTFFEHRIKVGTIVLLYISGYIVLALKPYVLYALLISGLIWLGFANLYRVKNRVLRVVVFPISILVVGFAGLWILNSLMSVVGGHYANIDAMLKKAVISQKDLKQEYYQGASFDIGDFEPTIEGALSVTPQALVAGIYRPFLWETRSIVMLLSGLENLILLILTIYMFWKIGLLGLFKTLSKNHFFIFCLIYTLSIALGVGLSTSNFGALVRFKIPLLPFFFLWLALTIAEQIKKSSTENTATE